MVDKHISRKLKGKVVSSYVTSAYTYGIKTMAMTEMQQEKLHVCENNSVRRAGGERWCERDSHEGSWLGAGYSGLDIWKEWKR